MQKIPTLFKKNPDNLALVINEINPGNEWVFSGEATATRKFDGTAAAIINGELYKRYDVKKGKAAPSGAIPCQEPDPITGHWPHWVKCQRGASEDKYFFEAFDFRSDKEDGTFELCGPKVQGNPENFSRHVLIRHGAMDLFMALAVKMENGEPLYSFGYFKEILSKEDIEGIVFHHPDGRMCKLRKSDFGIKRNSVKLIRS